MISTVAIAADQYLQILVNTELVALVEVITARMGSSRWLQLVAALAGGSGWPQWFPTVASSSR